MLFNSIIKSIHLMIITRIPSKYTTRTWYVVVVVGAVEVREQLWSWFSLSTFTWVLGFELGLSGLRNSCFYLLIILLAYKRLIS